MKYIGRALSAAVIAASLFSVGCKQSHEDRIYEAFKCGKAATMLGYGKEAAQAIATVEYDLKAVAGESSIARYSMELSARFQEDVPLYRYSAGDQIAALRAIFKTDTCQGLYSPKMLDLSSDTATQQESQESGETQASDQPPLAEPRTTAAAVLKVAREYVADAQGALLPNSVLAYCRVFATELSQPQDLQDCLRLVDMPASQTNGLPSPASAEAIVEQAESLSVVQRFAYCTSDPVVRYFTSFADYDRCIPESFDTLVTRELSAFRDMANEAAGVGPAAFPYNDPLWTASQLGTDERVAYCAIPAIQEQLEPNELRQCMAGQGASNEAPAATISTPRHMDGLARSALLKAAQMRSQEERDAFCIRSDVRALLTPSQVQECSVGLSPDDPAVGVRTDDDPDYRDEGH